MCPSNTKHVKPSDCNFGQATEEQRRMAELYADGLTCQKIADLFRCSQTNVKQTLHRLGVKMRFSAVRIPKVKHPQIIQLYQSGQSCKEIAEQFGCSAENIHQILRKHDVKMRPRNTPGKYSEDICRKMIDLYQQGNSLESIIARFGCSRKILNRILDEHEVERCPYTLTQFQPRFTKEDHQRMVAMYESGISQRAIAKEFGCSNFAMFRIFEKLGIEKRPVPPRHIITPDDREMIVKLRSQGKSYPEIAAKIGCSRETVIAVMRQLNVPIRIQGADAYSAEDQQRMADLYKIGMSMDEIAVGFDCGRKTVISVLHKHGVKVRPKGFGGQLTQKIRDQMLVMYEEGYSGAEIAAKYDCDLETVSSVIEIVTRKSQIHQRITALPNPSATDESIATTEAGTSDTQPIPLDSLVRICL